ncbi:putative transporter C11D3.18C [Pseudocercospora fuligena]|uniref:Putative transporter C11D3.18C n=1 Tax=Pseudocercospora fuligena TaxID=685502 RepID=A0A8H6RN81_9PEZI|nr:putative transporter C11D3.18C [Pseudocercospora fuligena]
MMTVAHEGSRWEVLSTSNSLLWDVLVIYVFSFVPISLSPCARNNRIMATTSMDIDKKDERSWSDASAQHQEVRKEPDEKASDHEAINPAMQKQLNKKFDKHIVPFLFGMWLLAFIDRTNIGNAKIDGLVEDLDLKGLKYNTALAIFYVPYIVVDVPSNLVLKYFKAGFYLPFILTCWGLCGTFMGFAKSYGGLLAARFFLGLCEGGLLGGMVLYLSMFYERHAMLWRVGLFYSAAPLSGAFGGLLATGLAQISSGSYNGWPFIFFGAITTLFGLICFFFLPNTPSEATFLTREQRQAAVRRMQIDSQSTSKSSVDNEKFDWHWVKMALTDINTLLLSLIFFLIITPIYSYSLFLPTIIKSLGYSRVVIQLFTVPPNIGGFITVLIACWISDRTKRRGMATGTGFQIMVANCAAFIATFTYIDKDAPRYTIGHAINIGTVAAAMVCITLLLFYNRVENRKRANGSRDNRLQEKSEEKLGSRHPNFRLTL